MSTIPANHFTFCNWALEKVRGPYLGLPRFKVGGGELPLISLPLDYELFNACMGIDTLIILVENLDIAT